MYAYTYTSTNDSSKIMLYVSTKKQCNMFTFIINLFQDAASCVKTCVVCYEDLNPIETYALLPCGHNFCDRCAHYQWDAQRCSLCRSDPIIIIKVRLSTAWTVTAIYAHNRVLSQHFTWPEI